MSWILQCGPYGPSVWKHGRVAVSCTWKRVQKDFRCRSCAWSSFKIREKVSQISLTRPCMLPPFLKRRVDFAWLSLSGRFFAWPFWVLFEYSAYPSASLRLISLLLKATARKYCLAIAVMKHHSQEQLKVERIYFGVWFQTESVSAKERHGNKQ